MARHWGDSQRLFFSIENPLNKCSALFLIDLFVWLPGQAWRMICRFDMKHLFERSNLVCQNLLWCYSTHVTHVQYFLKIRLTDTLYPSIKRSAFHSHEFGKRCKSTLIFHS